MPMVDPGWMPPSHLLTCMPPCMNHERCLSMYMLQPLSSLPGINISGLENCIFFGEIEKRSAVFISNTKEVEVKKKYEKTEREVLPVIIEKLRMKTSVIAFRISVNYW